MMLFGSCFSENIGNKLIENKFRTNANPFGILYNPLSVSTAIKQLLCKQHVDESELVFHNDVYQSFMHHGSFSDADKGLCLKKISDSFNRAATEIHETDVFFITFGTAYIYRLKSTGETVGNCHKFPPETFVRKRLSVEETVTEWTEIIETISAAHPAVKFIFTVSPIRHWKDGAHENQISKSILHLSIDKLQEKFPASVYYFPAYEILLDELRDYRFFAEDMMHPSSVAIDYIWEKFCQTYFSEKTVAVITEWQQIKRSLTHRPLNPETENHRRFLSQTREKLQIFQQKNPQINCNQEIEQFKKSMKQ